MCPVWSVTHVPGRTVKLGGVVRSSGRHARRIRRRYLFVGRAECCIPGVLRMSRDLYLPRLTAYRAVFHIRLMMASAFIDRYLDQLTAVWTARREKTHPRSILALPDSISIFFNSSGEGDSSQHRHKNVGASSFCHRRLPSGHCPVVTTSGGSTDPLDEASCAVLPAECLGCTSTPGSRHPRPRATY